MIRSAALFAMLLSAASLLAAPVPKEVKREFKFEGSWKLATCNSYGEPMAFQADQHWTLDAESNVVGHIGSRPAGNEVSIMRLVIDTRPDRKRVDFKYADKTEVRPGIYEFDTDGDTLRLCINMNTSDRPGAFETGANIALWTFKRVKAEGKK